MQEPYGNPNHLKRNKDESGIKVRILWKDGTKESEYQVDMCYVS